MNSTHRLSILPAVIMKLIIIAICLCATLAYEDRQAEYERIAAAFYKQDPKCGIYYGKVNIARPNQNRMVKLPWMMSIIRKNDSEYLCDGVLIYPDVLLANADCVKNNVNEELIVKAKINKLEFSQSMFSDRFERVVSEIHINPKYRACSYRNNLAILILSRPFMIDNLVNVACLPSVEKSFDYESCVFKSTRDRKAIKYDSYGDRCGDRVSNITGENISFIENMNCEQGNRTDTFIKNSKLMLISCKLRPTSKEFYYIGSLIAIRMCGQESYFLDYDNIQNASIWIHSFLKDYLVDTLRKIFDR